LGQRALTWQADVADREAVARLIAGTVEHFGSLDIAVANAGISIREPVIEAQWENVLRTLEVTQFGVFHTCQMAAQQMVKQCQGGRTGGKIIIISSVHAEIAVPNSGAYNMAKAAINHLGRTMAIELAPYCINVNNINPGWIDTPNTRAAVGDRAIRKGSERLLWERLGEPEEIGKAVAYLASDDAEYVTGSTLRVDGGFVLGLRFPLDD
jgi:glucose 1-dehydrogenase